MNELGGITSLAEGIHRRGLSAPAIFLLESTKPLAGVGVEFIAVVRPVIACLVGHSRVDRVLAILSERGSVDELINALEREQSVGRE
jgi:hypothetical protein